MRTTLTLSVVLLCSCLPAQNLRRAVGGAKAVVVATDIAVQPLGKHYILHRLKVQSVLKGDVPDVVSVLEPKGVAVHQRPTPAQQRLYCLLPLKIDLNEAKIPSSFAPYYKMSGYEGSNPLVDDPNSEPACELARIVIDSEAGTGPRDINARLLKITLYGPAGIRTEAVQAMSERQALRDALTPLQTSNLMARAVGETDDIPFKIALAELCAACKVDGLVDALCISVDAVDDLRFTLALGRIAAYLHGEKAIDVLRPHIVKPISKEARERLLVVLGATSTERALTALINMRANASDKKPVDAALRAHGSKRAMEAASGK